ncbi:MAG TPA: class I SAM-dependent methyltransferase [Thermoplasmata archaeon]|nr:class I SAM-dependent methyltransferase [Thermoplasmata archaeon]
MAPSRDPKTIVRTGFNVVSRTYWPSGAPSDAFGHTLRMHRDWLEPLVRRLRRGAAVLDLGCGCGVPDAQLLSERFRVTGVDISDVQIARARRLVPGARFLRADMTEVVLPTGTFGGVVCLYALVHVPVDEQPRLLAKVHRWLEEEGLFLVTTGATAWTGIEEGWLGSNAPMYWSQADATTYAAWLEDAGFRVLRRELVDAGRGRQALFLAQKDAGGPAGPGARASALAPPSAGTRESRI